MSAALSIADPFESALGQVTAPYARGAATLSLAFGPAVAGLAPVLGYSFGVFQSQYGVQTSALEVTYALLLTAPLGDGPASLEIDYSGPNGNGTALITIPAGTLPGTSFIVPVPPQSGLVVVNSLLERPAPAVGQPAGGDKWQLTALLGNTARLLDLLMDGRRTLAATARDVLDQGHLLTARGGSLDLIGIDLNVPRRLPAPYRVDLDTSVIALYHLDDAVAPVLDETHDHPGVNHGATRGAAGRIAQAAAVLGSGGMTVPDAPDFAIAPDGSFTVEMFVQLRATAGGSISVLAAKRAVASATDATGWVLRAEGLSPELAQLQFIVTDNLGRVVQAAADALAPGRWVHIAGVLDGVGGTLALFVDGISRISVPAAGLQGVRNCADIGLGADRTGIATMTGLIDEVRFSSVARTDFTAVVGGAPYTVDPDTIALYHLDETDDWIDEDRGVHYGLNHGATRGVAARFDSGLRFDGGGLPEPHCTSELTFQRALRTGQWDRTQGAARVTAGPYARYGYRQGAILLPALEPVLVNDAAAIDPRSRGMVTTACYGFVPADLTQTINTLTAAGRSVQEAIDYYGDWNGQPEAFFTAQYAAHGITAPHLSCLPTAVAPPWVEIPASPEFAIDAATSLTVEAIIKPDATADAFPRAVAASRSSGLRDGEPPATEAGWALAVGIYDGVPNGLRWVIGDTAGERVILDAGVNLGDGLFHHVAGVLDRDAATALLFVDGVEVAKAALGVLGAPAAAADIVLGNDPALDAPYMGVIDEVRLSRSARRQFHPVLGESDARYRQRLALYRRFRLPTAETIRRGVAALSLPVTATADDAATAATNLLMGEAPPSPAGQLGVLETDSARFCVTRSFRIVPASLVPGDTIAADGTMPADETASTGPYNFHMGALVREPDGPGLNFPTEAARLMTLRAARGLEALAARVHGIVPAAQIVVQSAWDRTATGLHPQGRALDVALAGPPTSLNLGMLGALAHAVGVDHVAYDVSGAFVRLSFAAGADLDLAVPDVVAPGATVEVSVARPTLPPVATPAFRLVRCGSGNGTLAPDPAGGPGKRLFTGTILGSVTIAVECTLPDGGLLTGAKEVTIAPDTLGPCAVLPEGEDEPTASGAVEADFQQAYLVRSAAAEVDYASEPARHMQLPLETALLALSALAAVEPGAPRITVLAAFDAAAATLQSVGRGLVVAPSSGTLTAARLGALAWRAGFAYVEMRRYPSSVYASVPVGERFVIQRSPIRRLWPNARISGIGQLMASEFTAAGPPDPGFNAGMLVTYTAPGVLFSAGVSRQMQSSCVTALSALVAALAADTVAGTPRVDSGFDPKASDLTSVGRGLLLRHSTIGADLLSGYALRARFGFVQHRASATGGPAVYAAAYPASGAPPNLFSDNELVLNVLTELAPRPRLVVSGSVDWCLAPCCGAAATLSTALADPTVLATPGSVDKVLRGTAIGTITVDAALSFNDAAEPYQFIIVPAAIGDGHTPRLTKDQYDDLLNFLDAYHPLGVEVVTRSIRGFVHGFRKPSGWSQLPTAATFPTYRTGR